VGAFQVADPPPGEFGQEKGRRHHADFLTPAASGAGNHPFPDHRHLKSSSPQRRVQDNETKAGIFPGKVIIVESGKLYVIKPIFSIDCGGLGTPFLSHHFLRVK